MNQPFPLIDLRDTKEYRELGYQIVTCPVCGGETLDNHWICPSCGWEYDGTMEEDTYSSCNRATPRAYREENRVR